MHSVVNFVFGLNSNVVAESARKMDDLSFLSLLEETTPSAKGEFR